MTVGMYGLVKQFLFMWDGNLTEAVENSSAQFVIDLISSKSVTRSNIIVRDFSWCSISSMLDVMKMVNITTNLTMNCLYVFKVCLCIHMILNHRMLGLVLKYQVYIGYNVMLF